MTKPVQFVVECVAAVVVAAPVMGVAVGLAHLWSEPLPRPVLQAIVYGTLIACFLVATLRPGGSLRRS